MFPRVWKCVAASLLGIAFASGLALAEDDADDGEAFLDQAIEAKRDVKSLDDLSGLIDLCQKAIDAGLKDPALAKELLASSLQQRAAFYAQHLMSLVQGAGADPRLAQQYPKILAAAQEDLERAIENDSEQIDSYVLLGQISALPGGNKKTGIEALNKAAELTKERPELHAKLLVTRAGLREDNDERMADLSEALKSDPINLDGLRARAVLLFDQKKYDEGLADLDAALAEDAENGPTHELRGMILAQQEKYEEALEALDKAVDLQPRSAVAYAQRGRVRLAMSDTEKGAKDAVHDLDKALLLAPDNPQILMLRAGAHQMNGDDKKALADVEAVLKILPDSAQAHRAKALLLAGSGNIKDAIGDLKAALQENPKDATMLLQLGVMYTQLKDKERAFEAFTQAIEADPRDDRAYQMRGDTHIGIGQHVEALADYDKALELKPDNTGVLNNAAWLLATSPDDSLRDGKRAIALAEEACRLTEYKAAHIVSTLAAGFAESGDFETAIKWSTKAVELGADPKVQDHLKKELASYQQGKPWRERQTGEEDNEEESEGLPDEN